MYNPNLFSIKPVLQWGFILLLFPFEGFVFSMIMWLKFPLKRAFCLPTRTKSDIVPKNTGLLDVVQGSLVFLL